jgi:hypothetical protein
MLLVSVKQFPDCRIITFFVKGDELSIAHLAECDHDIYFLIIG